VSAPQAVNNVFAVLEHTLPPAAQAHLHVNSAAGSMHADIRMVTAGERRIEHSMGCYLPGVDQVEENGVPQEADAF